MQGGEEKRKERRKKGDNGATAFLCRTDAYSSVESPCNGPILSVAPFRNCLHSLIQPVGCGVLNTVCSCRTVKKKEILG